MNGAFARRTPGLALLGGLLAASIACAETVVVEGAFLIKAEGEKAEGEGGHHDH